MQETVAQGTSVNSTTLERVGQILRDAPAPVNRAFLHAKLKALGAGTTPPRLNVALDFWMRYGQVVEGSKGIQWTGSVSADVKRARAIGRRL